MGSERMPVLLDEKIDQSQKELCELAPPAAHETKGRLSSHGGKVEAEVPGRFLMCLPSQDHVVSGTVNSTRFSQKISGVPL